MCWISILLCISIISTAATGQSFYDDTGGWPSYENLFSFNVNRYNTLPQGKRQPETLEEIHEWQQQNAFKKGLQKRGLSVLSRWRPLTSTFTSENRINRRLFLGGIHRFTARSPSRTNSLRPMGQPLRWGRR